MPTLQDLTEVADRNKVRSPLRTASKGHPLHWAKREFTYADHELLRGEVFDHFGGQPNDEKLLRLNLVGVVKAGEATYNCSLCGRVFANEETRRAHQKLWHPTEEVTEQDLSEMEDRDEERAQKADPVTPRPESIEL